MEMKTVVFIVIGARPDTVSQSTGRIRMCRQTIGRCFIFKRMLAVLLAGLLLCFTPAGSFSCRIAAQEAEVIPPQDPDNLPPDSEEQEEAPSVDIRVPGVLKTKPVFTDTIGHANRKAIGMLADRGIVGGTGKNSYSPDSLVTRAQFATIVVRALGLPLTGHENPFGDVAKDSVYAPYISAACAYGIMNGKTAEAFRPSLYITRQEASVALLNVGRLCGMNADLTEEEVTKIIAPFYDTESTEPWARQGLAFCFNENIFTVKTLYIHPQKQVTRGQTAEIVYRLLVQARLL